jgi:hypothetical protein
VSDNAGNSAFRNPMVEWLARHIANEPHFCCAYNQTREQVLCSHVDLADLSPENLREKLALLTPGSGKALWLSPFRGIAQSNVDSPIDLLFLDCSNCVMAMAESFPIAQPTTCNWPAGTALALPVQSIASSGTLPGDQLVLCSPEEMESRFAILRGFGTDAGKVTGNEETQDLPINPHNVAHHPPPIRNEAVQLTNGEEILEKHAPPSTEQLGWITDFFQYCSQNGLPLDFDSTDGETVQLTNGEEILEKHAPPVPSPALDLPFNPHNVAHHPPQIRNEAVQLNTGEEILEKHAPPVPAPAQDLPFNPHNVAHHPPPIRNEAVQLTTGEETLEKHAPPVPAPAQDPPFNLHNVAHHPPPIHNKAVQLTTGEEILENHAPPSPAPAVPEQSPARTEAAENSAPANGRASSKWNWLHWLLSPENPDKRMFPRENLPWVAAYFFNGGPPAPASVRNISLSGMFVVTTERWYLGTIIRFTLADWRAQPPDRYVTINAEAVRWGDDGVGLRFLYQRPRRGEHNRTDPSFSSVTPRQLYEFIQCLKPGTSSQSQRN